MRGSWICELFVGELNGLVVDEKEAPDEVFWNCGEWSPDVICGEVSGWDLSHFCIRVSSPAMGARQSVVGWESELVVSDWLKSEEGLALRQQDNSFVVEIDWESLEWTLLCSGLLSCTEELGFGSVTDIFADTWESRFNEPVVGGIERWAGFESGDGLGAKPWGRGGLIFGIPIGVLGRILSVGRNLCISIYVVQHKKNIDKLKMLRVR